MFNHTMTLKQKYKNTSLSETSRLVLLLCNMQSTPFENTGTGNCQKMDKLTDSVVEKVKQGKLHSSSEMLIGSERGNLSPIWCACLPGAGYYSPITRNSSSEIISMNYGNILTTNGQINVHLLRFGPDQDIYECLVHHILRHHLSGGFIITCCGSVKTAHLRLANLKEKTFSGPFEIVSLVGTLTNDGHPHLHIALADSKGCVFGGHLLRNTKIHTTLEIVFGITGVESNLSDNETSELLASSSSLQMNRNHKCMGIRLIRKYSEETGFDELDAEIIPSSISSSENDK
ncbi:unnamed protein product [Heterobilharzia americana]|nr:unnamed protein product [Heterobilharzia americana]CAH8512138.1 unnamed protein product [Heterobilharzia americana]